METGSGRENEKKKEQEEEEDPPSSAEDGGLSPVAMTTKPQLLSEDAGIQTAAGQQAPPEGSGRGA